MPRPRALIAFAWPLAIAALVVARCALHDEPLDRLAATASDPRDPAGTVARVGTIAIARGGPLVIGFQSSQPARLVLAANELVPPKPHDRLRVGMALADAHRLVPALATAPKLTDGRIALAVNPQLTTLVRVVDGTIAGLELELRGHNDNDGLVQWVMVGGGPAGIRVAGPPDTRLIWQPVGRRGVPEYVPASSLSPEPPERAEFTAPGSARLDGAIALAVLIIIIGWCCWLARARLAGVSRASWLAIGSVTVVALVARLIGIGDQGQTFDETVNWAAGRNYITNLLALDFAPRSWLWNYEHPPVMKLLDGIGAQFADGFGPARVLSAVWSSLGCALVVPIGRRLFRLRVGVAAGLIAGLLPTLVAHGQIVGHESPTILWWALAILLALAVHDGEPSRRQFAIRLAALGAVIGLATASRFVNGLVGPLCALIVVAYAPRERRRASITLGAAIMPSLAVVTIYAVWPRLWVHPIANLSAAFAKLDSKHGSEPFLGVMTESPGLAYFPRYLIATLPLGVLIAVLGWMIAAIRDVRHQRWQAHATIVAWLLVPLIGMMLSPVRQDGVRYVMPCVLVFAVMAAVAIDAAASVLASRVRWTFAAGTALACSYLVVVLVRTAPYYLDYFGEHTGSAGEVAAARQFETAWWGEGLDRAIEHVNANAAPRARVYRECLEPVKHLGWFRADLWSTLVDTPHDAEWLVVYAPATRACPLPSDARLDFEVIHDGAVLAAVYRR